MRDMQQGFSNHESMDRTQDHSWTEEIFLQALPQNFHKIVRPFKNDYEVRFITKCFSSRQHLKSHLNFHVDVGDDFMKPARVRKGYECEICHKVIQLRKHMQGHIRKVHGSILHECTTCKRLFKER